MKVLIVYGGRGFVNDPTLTIIEKIKEVLGDLQVEVTNRSLQEKLEEINNLPLELSDYQGIILATTVEWFGIGGLMQTFLDACWHYADKETIKNIYMMPVVCSTLHGEREAEYHLLKAWDLIGGIQSEGICAYFPNSAEVETSEDYISTIEKKTEDFYRKIKQKRKELPKSLSQKEKYNQRDGIDLLEKSSDQLDLFKDKNTYIKRQQEDIEELSSFFKLKLENTQTDIYDKLINTFTSKFKGMLSFKASYNIYMTDKKKHLFIDIDQDEITCTLENQPKADVNLQATYELLNKITNGQVSFQRSFMTGEITAKGDFKLLYTLDQLFQFRN